MTNPNPAYKSNILAGLQVPASADPEMRKFLQALKQHVELSHGSKGQPNGRFVTVEDLRKAGLAEVAVKGGRSELVSLAGQADDALVTKDETIVQGARGSNEALANLLTLLEDLGIITDNTSA